MHKGVKFPCNQCDYQATNQSNLKVHVKSIHEGVKYACEYCSIEFSFRRALRKHVNYCKAYRDQR